MFPRQPASYGSFIGSLRSTGGAKCNTVLPTSPQTLAMSVLVIVEMFNALNNLSEDCSLLTVPPWANRWLLAAIATSVALHLAIVYVPAAALLFGVSHLNWCGGTRGCAFLPVSAGCCFGGVGVIGLFKSRRRRCCLA